MTTRNRIKAHRRIRAGDLVPHELNPRTHGDAQRDALAALYQEIGFARSLLAYEVMTQDGVKLKLIDGHLRQSMDPDMEVDVEVLDVNEDEARALLLSIDPLAQLAGYNPDALDALRSSTTIQSDAIANLWAGVNASAKEANATLEKAKTAARKKEPNAPEQFLVLIACTDEKHQVDVLRKLKREGYQCKALMS